MLSLWWCGNWVAWHKLHSGDELLVCGKNHSIPARLLPKAFLYRNPSLFPSSSCHVPPQTHNRCARPRPWLSAFLAQALLTLQKGGKRDVNYTPDWRLESTLASPLTADALIQTGHDCCWSGRVEGVTYREWTMSSIVPDDSDVSFRCQLQKAPQNPECECQQYKRGMCEWAWACGEFLASVSVTLLGTVT